MQLLQALPGNNLALVITDSLFSMDGDFADLKVCIDLVCSLSITS